jgi:hypothetical protein
MLVALAATSAIVGWTTDEAARPAPGDAATPGTSSPSTPTSSPSARPTQSPTTTPSATKPPLGTVPPPWLGTRPLPRTADGFGEIRRTPPALRDRRFTLPDQLPMLPGRGFRAVVEPAPDDVLARSTWQRGCPVRRDQLDWIRLTFWGFDGRRHTGELLVNQRASSAMVAAFRTLYADRFPIEQMQITTPAEQDAAPTGDGNDTSAFNCRPAVGQTVFSQHAYGLAVDVNPFQNPYLKGDLVLPELASAYRDRDRVRPGMILPDGPVVRAFARVGWGWGGSWQHSKDLQHFSANGR